MPQQLRADQIIVLGSAGGWAASWWTSEHTMALLQIELDSFVVPVGDVALLFLIFPEMTMGCGSPVDLIPLDPAFQ